ncbi:MAG: glycoside hydrolase family 3 N-terminal domain-containing protein [Candidatus Brocadiia bacterium]
MTGKKYKYQNPHLPIEVRVKDLLKRMTVQEKVKQLCAMGSSDSTIDRKIPLPEIKRWLRQGLGQLSMTLRQFTPAASVTFANEIQRFALEHTRLGIPVIIHDECLHGCCANGSASYPQAIGLASTWNPNLVERISRAIGRETRARGINQALSPTINICRDPRCGRSEETYGEDTYLTTKMAVAFVRGLQSQKVVATPKHFTANFVGDGGRDSNAVHLSERLLREIYFPAFEAVVRQAGALSLMAAYNSIDGIPCSANKWLLTDVLRKEWGFKGFVVSDYFSVTHLMTKHTVTGTKAQAAQQAVEAGMDVELPWVDCFPELVNLVKKGKLSEKTLDINVARVLRVKFWLGLFDNPYRNPDYATGITDHPDHRRLALDAARQGIVLLKNERVLPLSRNIRRLAVLGPNAAETRLGGYSGMGKKVVTPLQGLKNKIKPTTRLQFARGCDITGNSKSGFKQAIRLAGKSDAAILFMGNFEKTEGEDKDRCDLNLPGVQENLIKEICRVQKNVIVVLVNGSPVTMTGWIDRVPAVVENWYSGEEGGNALAEIIIGQCNPSGKLPVTFPRFTGQLPLYYNPKPSGRRYDYVEKWEYPLFAPMTWKDSGNQELFPFGHGLSYTRFDYRNLKIAKSCLRAVAHRQAKTGGKLEVVVSFDIKNTGKYRGDEVIQLYIRDLVSRLARPLKELKRFQRISLDINETRKVSFTLGQKDLSYLSKNLKYVLEPGDFEIMIGSSSKDIRLRGKVTI